MNIVLVDIPETRQRLLPLTFTRPVSELRIGILKISEKWSKRLGKEPSYLTDTYLDYRYPLKEGETNLLINGAALPTDDLANQVLSLNPLEALFAKTGEIIAICNIEVPKKNSDFFDFAANTDKRYASDVSIIGNLWDLFLHNGKEIVQDFELITRTAKSNTFTDPYTRVYQQDSIFVGQGVDCKAAILNAESGPIFIGDHVEIQEGSIIKGPVAICDNAQIRLGAKIRPNTTIGPVSKAGGEISNSIIQGYSNKAHDGFLGNSVIGEWCNIGADTNNSNLKNNYGNVKLWSYLEQDFKDSGQQFCGLFMGDHSKAGINTMFNTGTVTGICANIFGGGFPDKFIPSFSWGGAGGFSTYLMDKALDNIAKVYERRGINLEEGEIKSMEHLFAETALHRNWDK